MLEDNRAGVTVYTKLGYHLIGRHDITEDGRRHTEHLYQLDRATWLESPGRRLHAPSISGAEPIVELLTRSGRPPVANSN